MWETSKYGLTHVTINQIWSTSESDPRPPRSTFITKASRSVRSSFRRADRVPCGLCDDSFSCCISNSISGQSLRVTLPTDARRQARYCCSRSNMSWPVMSELQVMYKGHRQTAGCFCSIEGNWKDTLSASSKCYNVLSINSHILLQMVDVAFGQVHVESLGRSSIAGRRGIPPQISWLSSRRRCIDRRDCRRAFRLQLEHPCTWNQKRQPGRDISGCLSLTRGWVAAVRPRSMTLSAEEHSRYIANWRPGHEKVDSTVIQIFPAVYVRRVSKCITPTPSNGESAGPASPWGFEAPRTTAINVMSATGRSTIISWMLSKSGKRRSQAESFVQALILGKIDLIHV